MIMSVNLHQLNVGDVISHPSSKANPDNHTLYDDVLIFVVKRMTDEFVELENILDAEIYQVKLNNKFEYTVLYNNNYIMPGGPNFF